MPNGNAFANFGRPHRGKVLPATIIEQKNLQNSAIPHHHFPADMAGNLTSGGFVMNFVDYSLNDLNIGEDKTGVQGASDILESFLLPLPGQGIEDKQVVKFNESELGPVGGAVAGAAAAGSGLFQSLKNQIAGGGGGGDATEGFQEATEDTLKALISGGVVAGRETLKQLSQQASDAVGLAVGNVINPHMALLFQNVGLKQFSFTWKLAPASKEESLTLKNMINRLRYHTHPSGVKEGDATNFYLDYPNQVDLYYVGVNDFFHYFKRCQVTELSVNYQPEGGTILSAGTGAPAVVDLVMGFQEVEIWTQEDYADAGSDVNG